MTKLSRSEVLHIAKLASLGLNEEEQEHFSVQLSETLDYVERLKKLKTKNTKPTFQTTGLKNIAREDEVKPSLSQEQALKNAKSTYKGYFKIKAIL